MTLEAPHRIK